MILPQQLSQFARILPLTDQLMGSVTCIISQLAADFKGFSKANLITSSPTRHPKYPHLAFVCVFIPSTRPTSCDISISLHIIENMSTLQLVGANYNAPSQGPLFPGPSKGVPAWPSESRGTTGVHLRTLYPKLVLQIISALCREPFSFPHASSDFESCIMHTHVHAGTDYRGARMK